MIEKMKAELPRGSRVVLRDGRRSSLPTPVLLGGLVLAIVLVYLLLVVNFQSWTDPFIIITALPAALAGIVWMLFISAHAPSCSGAHRRDHVHGGPRGQRHPDRQLRA